MLDRLPPGSRILVVVALGILMVYGGFQYSLRLGAEKEIVVAGEVLSREEPEEESLPPPFFVHVIGAVAKPGVYALEKGKRIDDAVKLAEPTEKADLSLINLAALLRDGEQIYVPQKGEKPVAAENRAVPNSRKLININSAGAAELDLIPGIGPALAQRIIEYRENSGPFGTIEDITKVSGIGPVMFEKMKSKISVD